jgi:hypothetical protein
MPRNRTPKPDESLLLSQLRRLCKDHKLVIELRDLKEIEKLFELDEVPVSITMVSGLKLPTGTMRVESPGRGLWDAKRAPFLILSDQ